MKPNVLLGCISNCHENTSIVVDKILLEHQHYIWNIESLICFYFDLTFNDMEHA